MQITQLPPTRWQDYKKLRLEAIQDSPQSFLSTVEETEAETDQSWQDKIANMFFALNEADQLVGMAGTYSENKDKLRHVANVVSVYVAPAYRRQGVGKQLLLAVLAHLQSQPQVKKIQLGVITTQQEAYRLYESVGFKRVGELRRSVRIGEQFFDEYLMEILL